MGTAGSNGTGLWGYSPNHYGLHAMTDFGTAVYAEGVGPDATAIECFAFGPGSHALKAVGHSLLAGGCHVGVQWNPRSRRQAGSVTLFAQTDLVTGKARLIIRFPTGPVQVLATEA